MVVVRESEHVYAHFMDDVELHTGERSNEVAIHLRCETSPMVDSQRPWLCSALIQVVTESKCPPRATRNNQERDINHTPQRRLLDAQSSDRSGSVPV